jgi:hypothetical protein
MNGFKYVSLAEVSEMTLYAWLGAYYEATR